MFGGTVQNGTLTGGQVGNLFCVDFQNDVGIPSAIYQANLSSITTGSDLSNTRYGRTTSQWNGSTDPSLPITFTTATFSGTSSSVMNATALQRYEMIGYLVKQYALNPASSESAIQSAIWQIDAVNAPMGETLANGAPPVIAGSNTWLTKAADFLLTNNGSYIDSYLSTLRVVTNVGPLYVSGQNPAQEFITDIAPEPAGVALMLAALVAVLVYRKRSKPVTV